MISVLQCFGRPDSVSQYETAIWFICINANLSTVQFWRDRLRPYNVSTTATKICLYHSVFVLYSSVQWSVMNRFVIDSMVCVYCVHSFFISEVTKMISFKTIKLLRFSVDFFFYHFRIKSMILNDLDVYQKYRAGVLTSGFHMIPFWQLAPAVTKPLCIQSWPKDHQQFCAIFCS